MWGLSPSDNNAQIDAFKAAQGITNPCAGTQGGGPAAISIVTDGQNFLGYPTYCIVCPDKSMYFDACYPPSVACFDAVIADCPSAVLTAGFTSDITSICGSGDVNFTDQSIGSITEWNWTFEGGNPATSSDQNPTVSYSEAGTFDVELTVSDGTDSNTLTMDDYITVNDLPEVTLEAFDDVCIQIPAFELTGGLPAGGEYSGPGVSSGWFDPSVAGAGTHTIVYTYMDNNDCENSAEQSILVDPCTGLGELDDQNGISIFPNPSNGNFSIELFTEGDVTISVVDMLGVNVYSTTFSANGHFNQNIELNNADSGMYFVIVQSANEKHVRKLKVVN